MYLFYGSLDIARKLSGDNWKIYNFTSLAHEFPDTGLIPPNNLGAISEYDFDVKYMQYIIDNEINFKKFMKIIFDFYNHYNIFFIINYEDWSINLVESLLKLIQQRYGINATMINEIDDLYSVTDTDFDPYYGIRNFDMDKNRYYNNDIRNKILTGQPVNMY